MEIAPSAAHRSRLPFLLLMSISEVAAAVERGRCNVQRLDELNSEVGGLRCNRESLVPAYLKAEKACSLTSQSAVDLRRSDLYQFGVPTEMAPTARRLRTPYAIYWGFDRFQGLPLEDTTHSVANPLWKPGMYSEIYRTSPDFVKVPGTLWTFRPKRPGGRPHTVEQAVNFWRDNLTASSSRIKLVAGFYNESLTTALAAQASPAQYIDFNCDLYVSTIQGLRWLFSNRIARAGTLLSYDDWWDVSFGSGESLAHMEISREFRVSFDYLPHRGCEAKRHGEVFFRVRSVGEEAHDGVTPFLRGERQISHPVLSSKRSLSFDNDAYLADRQAESDQWPKHWQRSWEGGKARATFA